MTSHQISNTVGQRHMKNSAHHYSAGRCKSKKHCAIFQTAKSGTHQEVQEEQVLAQVQVEIDPRSLLVGMHTYPAF